LVPGLAREKKVLRIAAGGGLLRLVHAGCASLFHFSFRLVGSYAFSTVPQAQASVFVAALVNVTI
jgi:hypothetical protein